MSMEKFLRECRSSGGSTPAMETGKGRAQATGSKMQSQKIAAGKAVDSIAGKRSSMPSQSLSRGVAQATRSGPNSKDMALGRAMGRTQGALQSRALANGAALAQRSSNGGKEIASGKAEARRGAFAKGGMVNDGMKELAQSRSRDEKLERVGHKRGGRAHKHREHHFLGMLASTLAPMAIQGLGKLFGFKEGGNVQRAEGGKLKRGGRAKREHHFWGGPTGNMRCDGTMAPNAPMVLGKNSSGYPSMVPDPKANMGPMGPSGRRNPNMAFKEGGSLKREHHFLGGLGGLPGLGKLFGFNEGGDVSTKSMIKKLHSPMEKEPQLKRLGATRKSVQEGEPRRYRAAGGSMKAMYEKLHGSEATEPHMKRLGATKSNTSAGLPHRESKKKVLSKPSRLRRAAGGATNPYEANAKAEEEYWNNYSATHNPADKYEDVDTSSLKGGVQRYADTLGNKKNPNAVGDYQNQFKNDYSKFVGADQSKSNAIRSQNISVPTGPTGGGRPAFDANAMRQRMAAKASGNAAPVVDRRSDAYKAAAGAQNTAYRDQSMAETQQDKRRSGAFQSEMHNQRVQHNSDMQAADLTRHGYKQNENGDWHRGVWDQMQDANPGLTKAFGWIPGAKAGAEAAARGDVGGMLNAGKQAVTGAQDMAGKANGYIDKAKGAMGRKRGGPVNEHSKSRRRARLATH